MKIFFTHSISTHTRTHLLPIPLSLLLLVLLALSSGPAGSHAAALTTAVDSSQVEQKQLVLELFENYNKLISMYTWNAFLANPNSFLFGVASSSRRARRGGTFFRQLVRQQSSSSSVVNKEGEHGSEGDAAKTPHICISARERN